MKLKIVSLILIMFLIPGALILTACKKEEGYNLASLSTDFYSVAETEKDNIIKVDNVIRFDFSNHVYNNKQYLQETVNSTAPYTALKDYNELFQNMMMFSYSHIDLCASSKVELDAGVRNNLKQQLDDLHKSMRDVNIGINLLAEGLKLTQDANNEICLEKYKNLILMYEDMFQKASQFTGSISNIYYKNILVNSNPDITAINMADFDSNLVM